MVSQVKKLIQENALFLLVLLILAGAFLFLRTKGTKFGSLDDFDLAIVSGQPVVVEFYGNTWSTCLVAKPIVDGIEKDLQGRVQVIKLDVWSEIGRQAAQRYNVRGIPTLLVLDGEGEVRDVQVGVPDRKHTVEVANKLLLDESSQVEME